MRTSSVAAVVERLRPRLHIDPVSVLPTEIASEIFTYLSPPMLLEASRVSRSWREETLDSRLWKQKFGLEGWGLDMEEIRRFEQSYNLPRKTRSRRAETHQEQRKHRKRAKGGVEAMMGGSLSGQNGGVTLMQHGPRTWNEQNGSVEADGETQDSIQDKEMQDVEADPTESTPLSSKGPPSLMETQTTSSSNGLSSRSDETSRPSNHPDFDSILYTKSMNKVKLEPQLMQTASGYPRLNYHHVFKQKRKLEDNWNAGSYKSFQLPHHDHPEEAHSECVYTIQYLGKYLVSGSRDRTLRIWDLDTQRLVRNPLMGHTASVLCLQFDDSPKEDIIISGSSDTDVILWRFSTGKMLRKIPQAHKESVLNLKFDARFLVTCSKDKTIKIWSRHELRPGDSNYPIKGVEGGGRCPTYILDLTRIGNSIDTDKPLAPYTPLMLLESHGAAVNAIHIFNDQLVSASGDRNVKIWNIHNGVCISTCRGHTKGIACVQYDGKRIVSGSSDNTIRIYDPATQAEVACLQGHTRLVRTIQAAFGDFPGSKEQLEMEATEIDRQYFEARRSGAIPTSSVKSRQRNAGSRQPKDIMAHGAKLPPGGGGSRWGRIISGSYDETIIIWKKAPDGRWAPAHRLRQEEALRAAGGPLRSFSDIQHQPLQAPAQQINPGNNQITSQTVQAQSNVQPIANPPTIPHSNPQGVQAAVTLNQNAQNTLHVGVHAANAVNQPMNNPYQGLTSPVFNPAFNAQLQAYQHQVAAAIQNAGQSPNQQPSPAFNAQFQAYQQQQLVGLVAVAQNAAQNMHPPPIAQPLQAPVQIPVVANGNSHHVPTATAVPQPNARVFKLQFDARRIICCSQDPKIVGWDFANGDERIIECSRFFAAPQ